MCQVKWRPPTVLLHALRLSHTEMTDSQTPIMPWQRMACRPHASLLETVTLSADALSMSPCDVDRNDSLVAQTACTD